MNKLNNLKDLYEEYGDKPTIWNYTIIQDLKGNNKFECPECKGFGYISIRYTAYPSGLPD